MHLTFARAVAMASAAAVAAIAAPGLTQPVSVQPEYLTYHFDNARTGWNPHESMLTASAVASKRFGLIRVLPSDSVVYAQPLYVKGTISSSWRTKRIGCMRTIHPRARSCGIATSPIGPPASRRKIE